jgi:YHS domain-containing protein
MPIARSTARARRRVPMLAGALAGLVISAVASADLPPKDTSPAEWTKIRLAKYQLEKKTLAVQGYDPVAYFPEGDPKGKGKPTKGSKKYEHTYNGLTYRFSSTKNRDLFRKNPSKYEPAYGGWCAYAASKESYTEPNPKRFTIQNGRLMLFYDGLFGDTYKSWFEEGPTKLEPLANAFWGEETGERPPSAAKDDE